jgi:hypothetical protein
MGFGVHTSSNPPVVEHPVIPVFFVSQTRKQTFTAGLTLASKAQDSPGVQTVPVASHGCPYSTALVAVPHQGREYPIVQVQNCPVLHPEVMVNCGVARKQFPPHQGEG